MRRDTFLKMICNGVLQIETSYFIVDFFLIILYLFEKDSVREEWKWNGKRWMRRVNPDHISRVNRLTFFLQSTRRSFL